MENDGSQIGLKKPDPKPKRSDAALRRREMPDTKQTHSEIKKFLIFILYKKEGGGALLVGPNGCRSEAF